MPNLGVIRYCAVAAIVKYETIARFENSENSANFYHLELTMYKRHSKQSRVIFTKYTVHFQNIFSSFFTHIQRGTPTD